MTVLQLLSSSDQYLKQVCLTYWLFIRILKITQCDLVVRN